MYNLMMLLYIMLES